MEVRQWYVTKALESARQLQDTIDELSEEEVIAALELESGSRRRGSIIDRLISRAVRLNELKYVTHLKEKYHGTSTIESPVCS
jgi:hypothetical protein